MNSPPAYLAEYLNEIAKDEGFVEHSLHYESGSKHGDGLIADMVAVTIKGKKMIDIGNETELGLMCKLLPENKARREFFTSTILFDREVYVYNDVLPMFEKFQIERNISSSDGFFQYPKCYLAVADAVKDHYVIIMEDFKVSQYEVWDKMKPVDFDTSSIFLAMLGRLHGLSLALRDQKPKLFQKLLELDDIITSLMELPTMSNVMLDSIDKAIEYLVREDEIDLLKKLKANFKSLIEKLFAPNAAGQLGVLLHGDCWNNNFCFRSDANIESLDDHSGRLLIKLALGSTKDWFNEFMVQPVSKAEYAQYGKVLNYAKYEEYKKKQEDKERLDNLKMEKAEALESTSKSNQRRHGQRSDNSSEDERSDRRVGSAKSGRQQQHSDKYSSNRSYSISDDDDDDRRNAVVGTSKSRTSRRDSSPSEVSHRKSKNTTSTKSSDDSDSDRREKYSSSNKSSHRKTKSKKHFKSRSYSKDQRQRHRSSDEEDKHYKKKTKKSKRPRSRSRDRR